MVPALRVRTDLTESSRFGIGAIVPSNFYSTVCRGLTFWRRFLIFATFCSLARMDKYGCEKCFKVGVKAYFGKDEG